MKKRYWLSIMGTFVLASCKGTTTTPSTGSAAATAASAAPAAAAAANVIKPGRYKVCQDMGESGHGSVVGAHLRKKEWIEIRPFGANGATKVCFKHSQDADPGEVCPPPGSNKPESEVKVLWLAGNERMLAGESTFDHTDENGQAKKIAHFVQIFKDPNDQGEDADCDKPNVLTINFCTVDEISGELSCVGPVPHLGHVHGEN
jgi:hypothetical protein